MFTLIDAVGGGTKQIDGYVVVGQPGFGNTLANVPGAGACQSLVVK